MSERLRLRESERESTITLRICTCRHKHVALGGPHFILLSIHSEQHSPLCYIEDLTEGERIQNIIDCRVHMKGSCVYSMKS